jgi:hypothetical protein
VKVAGLGCSPGSAGTQHQRAAQRPGLPWQPGALCQCCDTAEQIPLTARQSPRVYLTRPTGVGLLPRRA